MSVFHLIYIHIANFGFLLTVIIINIVFLAKLYINETKRLEAAEDVFGNFTFLFPSNWSLKKK